MCEPTTIAMIVMAAGVGVSAVSAQRNASVQEQVARNNAKVSEYQAQDAERRGEEQVQEVRRQAAALRGTQRSMMASRGLDIGEGTPATIVDQTDFFAQVDQNTARNNGRMEAWGRRAQGANYSAEAAGISPGLAFSTSLLSGAGSVADRWATYSRPARSSAG